MLDKSAIKRILVISLSNIGDIILTFPVIDILLRDFPQAKVSVVVGPKGKELLEGNPLLDQIFIFDKHQPVLSTLRWIYKLRQERFDLVVDLRNTAIPLFLGARRITSLFLRRLVHQHMLRQHLNRLFSVHPYIKQFASCRALYISSQSRDFAKKIIREAEGEADRFILVAPGAADQAKRWPAGEFARLCDTLAEKYLVRIIFAGNLNDRAIVSDIMRRMSTAAIDLTGQLSLKELAALMDLTQLLITNDSAPAHLASYLQKPVVVFFGPTDPGKYGPWSERSVVLEKKFLCSACQGRKAKGPHQCMDVLKAPDALRMIDLTWGQGLWGVDVSRDCPSAAVRLRHILVVRTDRIGDVVLTMPSVRALRRAFPQVKISMLVTPGTKDLIIGNPDLDEVLVDDRRRIHRGSLGFFRLAGSLRKKKFDLAIVFHTKKRTNWLCFFAGIPQRLGYYDQKAGFLLTDKIRDNRHLGTFHESRYCLEVLKTLGVESSDDGLFVPLQLENEKWADNFLKQAGLDLQKTIIAVHPGASCPTKKWPVKFFIETIREILRRYSCQIVLVGTAETREEARQIRGAIPALVWDLTGQTSVGQLTSFLKRCRMLVSNDSGPVHIAAALGIGVVSIFTRNQPGINPERWGPLGPKTRSVAPPVDTSVSFAGGEIFDPQILEKVRPAQVLAAVDEVYKLC